MTIFLPKSLGCIENIEICFHEDHIIADFDNVAPGDYEASVLKQAFDSAASGNNNGTDFSGTFVKFDVRDKPQLAPFYDIHNGFLFQAAKTHRHSPFRNSICETI